MKLCHCPRCQRESLYHMVLIEDNLTRTAIVFQRDYHQNVEVTDTSPDGLTQAWNQGFKQVFMAFEQDIRKIDWGANHRRR